MPKGPRKLSVAFGTAALTHYGGVYLLHRFLTRIGFKHAIAQDLRLLERNNRYSTGEMVLALLYPMILGLERIETTQLLRRNGVFQHLTGLPSYSDATTLRRFLVRMGPSALRTMRAVHDRLLNRMMLLPAPPSRVILDVDSTVLVVYGRQEQARIGYNPIKRGRPSYHPLLCFEGQSRDFWHGELRPGDAHTASGVLDLLKACFAKVSAGVRSIIVRADKGFYDHGLVEWLEAQKAGFVIVARLTGPIKRRLGHLRYTTRSRGVEVAEFRYQPARWPRAYRFAVIRRPQPEEPSEQLTLFKLGRYHYQVLVTNLLLQPLNLWRFYNDRAGIELVIRQLKGDYALGHVPTRHFPTNESYFHLLLLAYNLINWFKRLCLPPEFQNATLQTLRQQILLMPAQLLRTGNRSRLNIPASGRCELAWRHAMRTIESLRL
jgi:Transposase DDE domain group 1